MENQDCLAAAAARLARRGRAPLRVARYPRLDKVHREFRITFEFSYSPEWQSHTKNMIELITRIHHEKSLLFFSCLFKLT